ncbi:hypothetical protein HDU99_010684, partial [Rhizoclosmatium hyalinum]
MLRHLSETDIKGRETSSLSTIKNETPVTYEQVTEATAALSLKPQALKRQPLKRNFSLDKLYPSFKVQPHIGTEFAK